MSYLKLTCNGPSFFMSLTSCSFDLVKNDFKKFLFASDAIVSSAPIVAILNKFLNNVNKNYKNNSLFFGITSYRQILNQLHY